MKNLMKLVAEVQEKVNAREGKFNGVGIEYIVENANFYDEGDELFNEIYISDNVERNTKVIQQMATITADKLKEFNGSVGDYLLSIHPAVFKLDDGQLVHMTGPGNAPKRATKAKTAVKEEATAS